jgi:hypothetical protein
MKASRLASVALLVGLAALAVPPVAEAQ